MEYQLAQQLPVKQVYPYLVSILPKKKTGRPRIHSREMILAAIFFVNKTGIQWSLLPKNFPPYKTVYHYFRKWTLNGVWEILNKKIREKVRVQFGKNRYSKGISLDSQSVRTFFGQGTVGFDGHKKVKGRRRHLLVDSLGMLIEAICLRGNIHDIKAGRMMINRIKNEASLSKIRWLHADYAYRGLSAVGTKVKILLSGVSKGLGFQALPQRWKVERSIAWLRGFRRTIIDYEKKTRYSTAHLLIAFVQIGGKKLQKLL